MKPQAAHVVSVPFSRPASLAGGPLVLLAMVLMVTAGGLTTNSVIHPATQAPALAVLALPVHVATCSLANLKNPVIGEPELVRRVDSDVFPSEMVRLGEERLNLPPPTC